jgi:heat shock protein HslJ
VDTQFRRDSQPEMFRDIFTLNFDGQLVSGTGAPNLYSSPYTSRENQTISIMPMRSTLMAALFEPENLSEHDFLNYLQNTSSWELINNNLILNSRTQDRREARLIFAP